MRDDNDDIFTKRRFLNYGKINKNNNIFHPNYDDTVSRVIKRYIHAYHTCTHPTTLWTLQHHSEKHKVWDIMTEIALEIRHGGESERGKRILVVVMIIKIKHAKTYLHIMWRAAISYDCSGPFLIRMWILSKWSELKWRRCLRWK